MSFLKTLPGRVFDYFRGRHTFFVSIFYVTGTILHLYRKLDHTYIEFMLALMSFITGHSIGQSLIDSKAAAAGAPPATAHGAEPG